MVIYIFFYKETNSYYITAPLGNLLIILALVQVFP